MIVLVGSFYPLMAALLLDSDSDSSAAAIPLVLCLAGFIYFGIMYARYRNSDERHHHEAETPAYIQNLRQYDQFNKHRRKLTSRSMHGRNDDQVEGALNEGGSFAEQMTSVAQAFKFVEK